MSETTAQPAPLPAPRCIHLRCKSLVVYGEDFEQDPEYQAGCVDWWCVLTMKGEGPDGAEAAMELCRNRERPCWREY